MTDVRARPARPSTGHVVSGGRPATPAAGGDPATPPMREEAARAAELRAMKRRATGVLVFVSVVFLAVTVFGDGDGWMGYVQAAAEASMVGGLADWFAVTALFRHPLGIPIPHTAVVAARKDQFGQTLGSFVQQNFLSSEVIGDRVRAARVPARAAAWLAEPANADTVARHAADMLVSLADVVKDDEVHRLVEGELRRSIERLPLAPLAGRALRLVTAEGRHQELLDSMLRGLEVFLDENRAALRGRFGDESPWWLPDAVEDRIFERLFDGVRAVLHNVNTDPEHELRAMIDERIAALVDRLEHAPELQERGEELKRELLEHPELRRWSSSLWVELKQTLREQASTPDSELRQRLAHGVAAAGRRLRDDPSLAAKADEMAETAVRYAAEHFHDELAGLVSGTIARWDAQETSRKLELLLGRDLQFIRINGTVVGGLAGVVIHAVAAGLG